MQKELKGDVLYVALDELAYNYDWYRDSSKINRGVQIISIEDIDEYRNNGYEFSAPSKFNEGTILVSHPFLPRTYMDITTAEDVIIREKLGCICKIAQKIGVKNISGGAVFVDEQSLDITADGHVGYKKVEVGASVSKDEKEKYASTYKISRDFSGAYTKDDYNEAIVLLKKYGLEGDPEVRDLVLLRNPDENNRLISQDVHMEVTREINTRKEYAFSLNVMSDLFKLEASVQTSISRLKKVEFNCSVLF